MAWGFQTNRIVIIITHTDPLHKKLSMLKADDILKLQQLIFFYYKYLRNNLPVYLQNWRLIFNYDIHNYDARIKKIYTYK